MGLASRGLRRVAIGLQIVYVGLAILVLTIVLALFGDVLKLGMAPVIAVRILTPVPSILEILGKILCLAVPEKAKASGIIYASAACTVLSLLIQLLVPVGNLVYLQPAATILNLGGTVLFLAFLRRLAGFLGRADQAEGARNVLIGMAVVVFLSLARLGSSAIEFSYAFLLNIPVFVGSIVVFIMYANLLVYLQRAARDHAVMTALE